MRGGYRRRMDGMDWMASAMRAARAQLDVATHNLANASSDGFRRLRSTLVLDRRGLVARAEPTGEQGGIRETGRRFDLALLGAGSFAVDGGSTRAGAFIRDRDGWLRDGAGRRLHGMHGPLRVSDGATIAADGLVREGELVVDRLSLPRGTTVRSGALEASNVDAIGETLAILRAQRAFETAQKTFVALDETRQKAVDDVGRLR
jgi:flagellar basal-body rod protein FlgF